MNKIYFYILGAFCWFNTLACSAIEKFEILPDLPEALSYAVQPASASTISGSATKPIMDTQSIGHEPSIISVLFSLIIVILLIYITGIIYAKLNNVGLKTLKRQQGDLAKSQVTVISTTQLGNNKTLHVVELEGKRMLIGASSGAIQLIKDLGSSIEENLDGEYSHIEIPNIKIPKIEIPKIEIPNISFAKLKTKTHKPISDVEKIKNENFEADEKINVNEDSIENEPAEVIIDSLFSTQNNNTEAEVEEKVVSEHSVNPDDFALYKKYLS